MKGRIACRIMVEGQKEVDHCDDQHTCVKIRRMDLGEVGWGAMGWIGLAKDRDQWRALVNVVMKLQVP
jgi:hypothetical protein